jgi:cellulose synthase/poly-beta-1,6-N-acetylglucosamine synthase-like glycosyltransferase
VLAPSKAVCRSLEARRQNSFLPARLPGGPESRCGFGWFSVPVSMVTIGIPAYNNAQTIRTAVESLLAQSFGDFRLLISDDCSTDATEDECVKLAAQDGRIRYSRQPRNLRYGNFRFLLNSASTPYFIWAAGDDRWHPAFVERCVSEIERHPSLVCAVSRVQYEQQGKPTRHRREPIACSGR